MAGLEGIKTEGHGLGRQSVTELGAEPGLGPRGQLDLAWSPDPTRRGLPWPSDQGHLFQVSGRRAGQGEPGPGALCLLLGITPRSHCPAAENSSGAARSRWGSGG